MPFLLLVFRSELLDQSVDLFDGLRESCHHVFGGDLKFVDETIHLVDEQNRLDLLFEGLANHCFCLGHGSFNRTSKNEAAVNSTHGTCDVATKVDVAWRIDEVDQVVCSLDSVDHGSGCCVDGDATSGLLFVEVQNTCGASQFVGHHSCACDEVVGKRGLTVVNVSSDAQVPDLRKNVHNFCCLLDVVFFASHGYHRVLVISPTEKGFLSASQVRGGSVDELNVGRGG